MSQQRASRRLQDAIVAYRRSPLLVHGACRFDPTCSHYAEEALASRRLPIAVLLILGRVIRCNPLVRRGTHDPLVRSRRGLRPNAVASFLAALGLAGGLFFFTASIAEAGNVDGGCTATINGADPSSLTKDNPLVVHKGERVSVAGLVPASVANLPKSQLTSATVITVSAVEGVFDVKTTVHKGQGPEWGGSVNVDNYLKYGTGLYRVTGSSAGTPGWSCSGRAYIRLEDGSPLGKPIGAAAAGLAVIGAAGAALSARGGKPTAQDVKQDFGHDVDNLVAPPGQLVAPPQADTKPDVVTDAPELLLLDGGCLAVAMLIIVLMALKTTGSATGAAAIAGAPLARPQGGRIWRRGHPVLGFISGTVAGFGASVLIQQYGRWTLSVGTVIVLPLLIGVLCAVRAWIGRPYKLR